MQDTRRERILGPGGPQGIGLEIGALNAPLLKKSDHQVLYVDYATTEVVRANQFDPAVNPVDIVEVDIVWGATPLREAVGRPVDYIVASHVIEHVPDLIGWLGELHAALRPGGMLGLAVPDKRFTFDALRKDSTLAEAVEAHLLAYRQPSLRQVFDVCWQGVAVDAGKAWSGDFRPGDARDETLGRIPGAYNLAESLVRKPRYNDAHCWVFTPASFLDLIEEFAALGAFPFAIEAFHPSQPGEIEFQLRLRALAAGEDGTAIASIRAARQTLAGAAVPGPAVAAEPAPEPQQTPELEPAPPVSSQELDRLARENQELRRAIAELRQSTSWRLTAPVRAVGRVLKGQS